MDCSGDPQPELGTPLNDSGAPGPKWQQKLLQKYTTMFFFNYYNDTT